MTKKTNKKINKLWGTAFEQKSTEAVIKFTAGRDVQAVPPADYKLLAYDLWGNKSHCVMLYKQGIITKKDAQVILKGLLEIETLALKGKFVLGSAKEDVHTNIESWLIEKYGIEQAGKLHTARSRNDQCNLDTRLYLKDQVLGFIEQAAGLAKVLIVQAGKYKTTIVPGFTHHQHAMVTTFSHILLAFAAMIVRDAQRFTTWFKLHNFNPLGNAVAYGTSFVIDQQLTSQLLGFDAPDVSSLDEITNRWEAESDLAFSITILMNHLSLMAQTLIIFSTPEFAMIQLADQFSTGSSIMPQKKNPDPLEVIKGKTAFAAGILQGLLGLGKANFIGFNRDSQWTKYLIMDLVDECLPAPKVMAGVIETMTVNKKKMAFWCQVGFVGATSLLEQLVAKYKIPFRQAKIVMEKAIKHSKGKNKVSYSALKQAFKSENLKLNINPKQVQAWQDPIQIIKLAKSFGGPSSQSLKKSSTILLKQIEGLGGWLEKKLNQKQKALQLLNQQIKKIMEEI
ncbi:argininosuccinate lyase [Patescibacteria group bacterium]|nr:argininosuccinate lyase [Patescibacteria group bacterium]MBU1931332.1 argininosuccinate lyase [Patescibacteria group bacterium]